ncbi:MAG: peptidoglycan recognition family protein [Candidatus Nanopelagicales bacterium]
MGVLLGVAVAVAVAAPGVPTSAVAPVAETTVARPRIVQELIPFGKQRKAQMARYSRIHYGKGEWRLHPRGVVEHFTATNSLASVFATFRSNAPDPELGQLPGTCAHFVIDRDGTIYQLVSLRVRCRHTVGLNHRMIGIEHVGMSDGDVMGDRRQRRASLRLTSWLVARYGLSTGDVIGHSESLDSRFRKERYGPWRCQTHGDFTRSTMDRYRKLLNRRLSGTGADTSPPRWVDNGC